ncbi:MAG: UDP-glucose 4-epimerase GalE [Christensenellales bacterium]|jgi:UDP-glucose 4-epimerase
MKVLVTGGTGYIGSHTVVELINQGYEVVIVDNLSNSSADVVDKIGKITGVKPAFHKVDLLDYDALKDVFSRYEIDSVIHFAGLKAVGESVMIPLNYYHNNITGTLNLLFIMKEFKVKKLVFSSSATVYGDPESVPIKETAKLSATNPYGRTKLFIEEILRDFYRSDNSFNIILLRYFNPVGAHKSALIGERPSGIPNNLMPYITQVAIGKLEYLRVFGSDYPTKDGTGVRDYIHITDLALGHLLALKKLNTDCGIKAYNLGTGRGYSVLEIINAFSKVSGKELPYKIVDRRPGDIAECYADPSLARIELGFEAKRGIEEMCADSWNFEVSAAK